MNDWRTGWVNELDGNQMKRKSIRISNLKNICPMEREREGEEEQMFRDENYHGNQLDRWWSSKFGVYKSIQAACNRPQSICPMNSFKSRFVCVFHPLRFALSFHRSSFLSLLHLTSTFCARCGCQFIFIDLFLFFFVISLQANYNLSLSQLATKFVLSHSIQFVLQ